jgi:hypothetical protein
VQAAAMTKECPGLGVVRGEHDDGDTLFDYAYPLTHFKRFTATMIGGRRNTKQVDAAGIPRRPRVYDLNN